MWLKDHLRMSGLKEEIITKRRIASNKIVGARSSTMSTATKAKEVETVETVETIRDGVIKQFGRIKYNEQHHPPEDEHEDAHWLVLPNGLFVWDLRREYAASIWFADDVDQSWRDECHEWSEQKWQEMIPEICWLPRKGFFDDETVTLREQAIFDIADRLTSMDVYYNCQFVGDECDDLLIDTDGEIGVGREVFPGGVEERLKKAEIEYDPYGMDWEEIVPMIADIPIGYFEDEE
jgi:hypothetical protein